MLNRGVSSGSRSNSNTSTRSRAGVRRVKRPHMLAMITPEAAAFERWSISARGRSRTALWCIRDSNFAIANTNVARRI
jgi:hypothetical protein